MGIFFGIHVSHNGPKIKNFYKSKRKTKRYFTKQYIQMANEIIKRW